MILQESRVGLAVADREKKFSGYENRGLIAKLISEALRGAGLGQTDENAPFKDIIEAGMTVLLKPNWVLHCNMGGKGMDCMITHPIFIEEVIKEIVKASPGRIILADAPIQRTIFTNIVTAEWQGQLRRIANPCRLDIIDFRKSIWCGVGRESHVESGSRVKTDYILFDLASQSLLEPISDPVGKFRNTCYNPDSLTLTHRPGCHKYLLSREVFEADVVINLPKLKSHRKAGITAAIKNLVGINGDKDYLPHHRIGGSLQGGDCYEGKTILKHIAEQIGDCANRRINTKAYYPLVKFGSYFMKLNRALYGEDEIEGGWHGNDTIWRMVLDLNRIALYGSANGKISSDKQRRVYSLTDAVIAGEGFGPLAPEPINLGAVSFATSSAFADLVHTALMRFDWRKIPCVNHAFDSFDYKLTSVRPEDVKIYVNDDILNLDNLAAKYGMDFRPAQGWEDHIELV